MIDKREAVVGVRVISELRYYESEMMARLEAGLREHLMERDEPRPATCRGLLRRCENGEQA